MTQPGLTANLILQFICSVILKIRLIGRTERKMEFKKFKISSKRIILKLSFRHGRYITIKVSWIQPACDGGGHYITGLSLPTLDPLSGTAALPRRMLMTSAAQRTLLKTLNIQIWWIRILNKISFLPLKRYCLSLLDFWPNEWNILLINKKHWLWCSHRQESPVQLFIFLCTLIG